MMQSNFDLWIDYNLNDLGIGFLFISVGILSILFGNYIHKKYQGQGYKFFRPFRRENKTQEEDNFFVIMFVRSLGVMFLVVVLYYLDYIKSLSTSYIHNRKHLLSY